MELVDWFLTLLSFIRPQKFSAAINLGLFVLDCKPIELRSSARPWKQGGEEKHLGAHKIDELDATVEIQPKLPHKLVEI
jgi:hypothetical protein